MGRYHSYINSSLKILELYKGDIPFSIFIKQFFAKEKKYGSKDRKQITSICYSWFRIGSALNKQLNTESLLQSIFLVTNETSPLLEALKPAWNTAVNKPLEEKKQLLNLAFDDADIFPFSNEINEQINNRSFYTSFLQQPGVFIRIRPQQKKVVTKKIKSSGLSHHFSNDNYTVQLVPGSNIENIVLIDKDAVIQDYNSQQVLNYLKENDSFSSAEQMSAWDCCAASGGKSILLYDILNGKVDLTVSDIRQSIIANLQQRFTHAGIKNYHHFIADISDAGKKTPASQYDIIICDAPCTGSGTWSRTPEQLYFFDVDSINEFAERQQKIAVNVLPHLKNNGLFFYITCSVFTKENENVVEHISQQKEMTLIEMKYLYGYEMKADSMFVAVFKKNQERQLS